MVSMPADFLSITDEAEAIDRDAALVSRRRRDDPRHPAHRHADGTYTDARTRVTRSGKLLIVQAPADAALAYWAATRRSVGRPATTPPIPAGLTKTQWQALQDLIRSGTSPSRTTASRLTARGMLDCDGRPTSAARALVAPTPQEQK